MTSGEWRGGEHFYLPDEFRLSLYTKNSAGELVPVADFQNQPNYGWQAITEDGALPQGICYRSGAIASRKCYRNQVVAS